MSSCYAWCGHNADFLVSLYFINLKAPKQNAKRLAFFNRLRIENPYYSGYLTPPYGYVKEIKFYGSQNLMSEIAFI